MAWIEPKTNWSNERMTHADMNRIAGNVNYLYPAASLKDDYTNNDYLTAAQYADLTDALNSLILTSGYTGSVPAWSATPETLNELETLILGLYNRIALNLAQAVSTIYAGDDLYSAASGQYPNIAEDYSRGV